MLVCDRTTDIDSRYGPCVLDPAHEGDHQDYLARSWHNDRPGVLPSVPVIDARSINFTHAEKAAEYGGTGTMEIDGVEVAYEVDKWEEDYVVFYNPGGDPEEGKIAEFVAVKEWERA
jgi:hypothetical protein